MNTNVTEVQPRPQADGADREFDTASEPDEVTHGRELHEAVQLLRGRQFRLPANGKVLVHTEKRGPAFTPVLTDSERIIVWDALQTAGELLQHLDLGRVQCAIAAYKRLQQIAPIKHAAPVIVEGLPPDAGRRAVQDALANINALDARRHWYGLACVMFTIASLQVTSLQQQIDFAIQHETGEDALEDGPSDAAALMRQQAFYVTFMAECQGVC